MLWYIFTRVIVSIVVLVGLHYLYNYLIDTLTVRKTKDLVSLHHAKYQEILDEMRALSVSPEEREIKQKYYHEDDGDEKAFLEESLVKLIETI